MFAASLSAGGPAWQRFRAGPRTARTFLPPVAYANARGEGGLPWGAVDDWVHMAPDPPIRERPRDDDPHRCRYRNIA